MISVRPRPPSMSARSGTSTHWPGSAAATKRARSSKRLLAPQPSRPDVGRHRARDGEAWGNFPQTYSMVGIINGAIRLSRPGRRSMTGSSWFRTGSPTSTGASPVGLAVAARDALAESRRPLVWMGRQYRRRRSAATLKTPQWQCERPRRFRSRAANTRILSRLLQQVSLAAFHYRLGLLDFEPSFIEGYRRVNSLLADRLANVIAPDDLVWIHDYHLIPLAAELRPAASSSASASSCTFRFRRRTCCCRFPIINGWSRRCSPTTWSASRPIRRANFQRYCAEHADGDVLSERPCRVRPDRRRPRLPDRHRRRRRSTNMAHTPAAEADRALLQRPLHRCA